MSACKTIRSGRNRIAKNLSCEFLFHVDPPYLECQWSTGSPPHELIGAAARNYKRARNRFVADISELLPPGQVLLIDLATLSQRRQADVKLALMPAAGNA